MISNSTIAISPGETIREMLDDRSMTQAEFALRMGVSAKHVSRLINGHVELTHSMARKLSSVLGPSDAFWNNLEAGYRADLARVAEENDLQAERDLLPAFPYAKMARLGWVRKTRNNIDKIFELRRFFEVASLTIIPKLPAPLTVYRRLSNTNPEDYTLLAWEQQARRVSRSMTTAKINIPRLETIIPEIRAMTLSDPSDFYPKLQAQLGSCGVALVTLPHIGGSYLHGATFYDADRIVLGVTVRGKDADRFWFSLFHEIGHIMLGDVGKSDGTIDHGAADRFSANTLIPPEAYKQFIANGLYSNPIIVSEFAKDIGIHPGIVVGRLQNDKYLPHTQLNQLKIRYELA